MANELMSLPQELRIQILSHLDAVSLTRCAMTCESIYKTLKTTSQLMYTIQLHFDGLKDAGMSTTYSELIMHLQRHREAWLSTNTIEERDYVAIDMKYQSLAYEIVGGAFADTDRQHFEIVWLPTSSNKGHTLQGAEPGIQIQDFAMDPTQDVIAFLEEDESPPSPTAPRIVRIHIHAISTNAIHPLAQQSPLEITIPCDAFSNVIYTAVLQFAHNTFAFYFCTAARIQPYIQIWDWTTSDVIVDCFLPFDHSITGQPYKFGILDSTYFFVPTISESGSIRLYKTMRSPSAPCVPIHLATLYFPPIATGVQIERIFADTGPMAANPLPHVPFMLNDDDRLHVFTIQYTDHDDHRVVLNMFVHQRVFTKHCTRRAEDGNTPLRIPWEEWGPMNTKFIYPARIERHLLRYIHGQRAIWIQPATGAIGTLPEESPNTVEILDFSLAAVLSAKESSPILPSSEKCKTNTLVTSSTIHAGQPPIFEHDVDTHLPYVSMEWNLKQAYAMYMIYEDGIIGANTQNGLEFLCSLLMPLVSENIQWQSPFACIPCLNQETKDIKL